MPSTSRSALPLLLLAVLTACASTPMQPADPVMSPAADGQGEDRQESSPSASAPASAAAFPVAIEHRFGQTEIVAPPKRIVTVGLTDHDAFLALGVAPVGVVEWYGAHPHATWPWAVEALGDAEPMVVGSATELNFEKIAALAPDLIVGLYSAMTQEEYDTLSQIAPTVAPPGEHADWSIPWQKLTLTAGRVIGRVAEAERLVADIEDRIDQVRAEHPEFVGSSAVIAVPFEGIYVYGAEVANGRLLASLGLEVPAEIAELIGETDGASLSLERIDLLDVDVLVWLDAAPGEGPLAEPLYERLDVHREGRELFIASADPLGGAMSFSSVLSLPFLLDELVPMLEAAIDGDPSTQPEGP